MYGEYNQNKEDNESIIDILINQEGYVDLGWANLGKSFSHYNSVSRELDCSMYSGRGTNIAMIDDIHKEILHVDMSD